MAEPAMVKHLFRNPPGPGVGGGEAGGGAGGREDGGGDDSVENGDNLGSVEDGGEEVSVQDAEDAGSGVDDRGVVVMLVAMVWFRWGDAGGDEGLDDDESIGNNDDDSVSWPSETWIYHYQVEGWRRVSVQQ
jgi:hypothetical protein